MSAKAKVSIEPKFNNPTQKVVQSSSNTTSAAPAKKKVVKKIIRKVVKKPAVSEQETETNEAIKRAATTVDKRDHAIKSDYLDKDVPLERSNLRLYIFSIGLMVVFILITVGLIYTKGRIELHELVEHSDTEEVSEVKEEQTVEVTEIEDNTVEEVVPLDPEDITLEILNGSGVAGAAGNVQTEFEDLGYVVGSIGNSDETEVSELYISNEFSEEELATLLEDVDRRLGITEVTGSLRNLDTTARIILGAE